MIDTAAFSSWIGLETQISKQVLTDRLQQWESDTNKLHHLRAKFVAFQEAFKKDPNFFPTCKAIFTEIATIEAKLTTLMNQESSLEEETYNELLFLKPHYKPFNFIPYVLTLWAVIRVYIIPGFALLIPLLILFMPYIILTHLFKIPITFSNYTQILNCIISGNVDFLQTGISSMEGITLKQCGIIGITLVQGVIQPYWTYSHLHSVDTIIQENGTLIMRYKALYEELRVALDAHGFTFFTSPLPEYHTARDATASVILHPNSFKIALRYIGSLEILMTLASRSDIRPVKWISGVLPQFHGEDLIDFHVLGQAKETAKPITIHLDTKRHALLTGPNKGGKSTVLRAITVSMLLAHTYGCGLGHIQLTPFQRLHICLTPDDLPGSKSRFEREIEFTAETLRQMGPTMVLIDELYHSTNPPDALRSCEIYCKQLWKKTNIVSVISTHLFDFVAAADHSIQRLCCPATEQNGTVQFEYGLKTGICTVSSVDVLLKKNGLDAF
jgi:hypothetical protein